MFQKLLGTPMPFALRTMRELHANLEIAGGAMILATIGTVIYFAFTYAWWPVSIAAPITLAMWAIDMLLVAEIRIIENPPKRAEDEWQRS